MEHTNNMAQAAVPLKSQVAGHGGVMSDASGSLVIKPALPREIAFYQLLSSTTHPTLFSPTTSLESPDAQTAALYDFKRFVPRFLGTLKLEGQMREGGGMVGVDRDGPAEVSEGFTPDSPGAKPDRLRNSIPKSIVIENLSHPYKHPSVLDVKLGTHLAAPDAPEAKIARMETAALSTTSRATGIRLTGFSVWDPVEMKEEVVGKAYGKGLKKEQLPEGIARFFAMPTQPNPSPPGGSMSEEGYKKHLVRTLKALYKTLAQLHEILSRLEVRFVGASLLIVYEGAEGGLAEGWGRVDDWTTGSGKGKGKGKGREVRGDGLGPEWEDDEDDDNDDEEDEASDDASSDDQEVEPDEDELARASCPPWSIRMIDFAHTWLCEGEGVDEGVLLGLKTLGSLVRGRIGELEGEEGDGVEIGAVKELEGQLAAGDVGKAAEEVAGVGREDEVAEKTEERVVAT